MDVEKQVFALYAEALDTWKDSGILWSASIELPQLSLDADRWYNSIGKVGGGEAIAKTANYKRLVVGGKLPIEMFPNKIEMPSAVLAKQYNIPISEQDGWRYIPEDSFKLLWPIANAKVAEANKISKSR